MLLFFCYRTDSGFEDWNGEEGGPTVVHEDVYGLQTLLHLSHEVSALSKVSWPLTLTIHQRILPVFCLSSDLFRVTDCGRGMPFILKSKILWATKTNTFEPWIEAETTNEPPKRCFYFKLFSDFSFWTSCIWFIMLTIYCNSHKEVVCSHLWLVPAAYFSSECSVSPTSDTNLVPGANLRGQTSERHNDEAMSAQTSARLTTSASDVVEPGHSNEKLTTGTGHA